MGCALPLRARIGQDFGAVPCPALQPAVMTVPSEAQLAQLCKQKCIEMYNKRLGHRVAIFVALLLVVFQFVAVQPGYLNWAFIEKKVDHPIDCNELSCYIYDDYEVSYGLFDAKEKFCADCDSEGSSSQCYWGTSCRRRQLYYASGDEVDLDDADLLDDVLSEE